MDDRIPFATHDLFYVDRPDWIDDGLVEAARACLAAQRATVDAGAFRADPQGEERVSETALQELLRAEPGASSTRADVSYALSFNFRHIDDSIASQRVRRLRRELEERVAGRVRDGFRSARDLDVVVGGHFWYPPGGTQGWHASRGAPGWQVHLSHAEEPDRSFFRYRDPATGEILTSPDREWDVRVFRVDPAVPFWHAVSSRTNRFRCGFLVGERLRPGAKRDAPGLLSPSG